MKARKVIIGFAVLAMGNLLALAQTPVLGSIEAPYPNMQSSVQIANHLWGPGTAAYGPVGTPLVLSGSDLGDTGTVQFIPTKNGAIDSNASPVNGSPTMWSSTMIFVPVPAGAFTGLVQVNVEGKASNRLPFIVMPGNYAASCPASPPQNQLQIVTSSLHDGSVNQSYSATLSASGGTQAYSWSLAGGTLPAGLSLNPSTGVISGTPTASVSQTALTFEVTDHSSPPQINEAVFDLTVEGQQLTSATVYAYSANYDGDGNVQSYSDTIDGNTGSIMGSWSFTYDSFNRLQSGHATAGNWTGQNLCWAYDSYGNRTMQSLQTAACSSPSGSTWVYAGGNNRVTGVIAPGGTGPSPSPLTYDAAGNVTVDLIAGNQYAYDGEGRICAVQSPSLIPGGQTQLTGYLYDTDGNRVAKGNITNGTINSSSVCDPTVNGFTATENYVLGLGGEELSMLDGNDNWRRTNVSAGGKLVGTYDVAGLHFHLEDPLGTRRMQLSAVGQPETDIQSLPYGDQLYSYADQYAPATADDATPLHFTGKERDTESGNDYFGARYYASTMGRWTSPDPSGLFFADPANPQSMNLYAYVANNPINSIDTDGPSHDCHSWHLVEAKRLELWYGACRRGNQSFPRTTPNVAR